MKKYITFAAILGLIAFISVSYLAQAQSQNTPAISAPTSAQKPASTPDTHALPPHVAYMKDSIECNSLAAAANTEGATPTPAAKEEAFKKCMMGKTHTADEITKEEEMAKSQMTPPAKQPVAPPPAAK